MNTGMKDRLNLMSKFLAIGLSVPSGYTAVGDPAWYSPLPPR
jgi:hypothetical protein